MAVDFLLLMTCLFAATIAAPLGSKATGGSCVKGECAPDTVLLQQRQHHHVMKHQHVMKTSSEEEAALDAAAEEALLKLESSALIFSTLAYERDLTENGASWSFETNASIGLEQNIINTFDDYMTAHPNITVDFSDEELHKFKNRVVYHLMKDMKSDNVTLPVNNTKWVNGFLTVLEVEKPVVTRAGVVQKNAQHPDYGAKHDSSMADLSKGMFDKRNGLVVANLTKGLALREIRKAVMKSRLRNTDALPESFDARTQWAHCSSTITHVRNQGFCGSCWAFATAAVADAKLCIATNGEFSGSGAYISAGYLTSCGAGENWFGFSNDGCDGNNPQALMQWMAENGAPTGYGQSVGCSKYFRDDGDSDFLETLYSWFLLLTMGVSAPECPTACDRTSYPRSMSEDMFSYRPWDGNTFWSYDLDAVKASVMESGPAVVLVYADYELQIYSDGIWSPDCDATANHAVVLFAWGVQDGQNYLHMINSWSKSWGDAGTFKMTECGFLGGVIAPALSADGHPLPLPEDDSPSTELVVPRYTADGGACAQTWVYYTEVCSNYCCTFGTDENGENQTSEWCMLEYNPFVWFPLTSTFGVGIIDPTEAIPSWGYCDPIPPTEPTPTPTPSPSNSWQVVSGTCAIDTAGCATSPYYPHPYLDTIDCEIDTGEGSNSIYVESFSTEPYHDVLTVNNVEYSGTNAPHNVFAEGTIYWRADSSIAGAGWKLCPTGELSAAAP